MAIRVPKFITDLFGVPAPSPGKFLVWSSDGGKQLVNADGNGLAGPVGPTGPAGPAGPDWAAVERWAKMGIVMSPVQPTGLITYEAWVANGGVGAFGWIQTP